MKRFMLFLLAFAFLGQLMAADGDIWTEKAQNPSWWPFSYYDASRPTVRDDKSDIEHWYHDCDVPCPTNRMVELFNSSAARKAQLVVTNVQFVATDDPFKEVVGYWPTFMGCGAYLDGKYMTLPECLETKPIDTGDEDEEKKEVADDVTDSVNEAEEASEDEDEAEDGEEKKDKIIYYVTDEQQQSQYINMFRQARKNAVILTHNIDQPFVSQLESKNEGIKFMRIDADLTDEFLGKTSKKAREEMDAQAKDLDKIFKKALKNEKITVKVEKLKNKKISSMITLSEETRRMQDMMKMYGMGGMNMPGMDGEGETLVLNAGHPLVKYILEHSDSDNTKLICEQLYDLAKLQHAPLAPEAMTRFIQRSNDIMCIVSEK